MSKAPQIGRQAEQYARRRYGLQQANDSWRDAVDPTSGRPVEIKTAAVEYPNGRRGRFRIFKQPHDRLAQSDGYYVLVAYDPPGFNPVADTTLDARRLTHYHNGWYTSNHSTDNRNYQVEIPTQRVF